MTVERLKNSRTAVFEASMSDDYAKMQSKDPDRTPVSASTGNANSIRANRVSWHFGLLGPSIHVDTACSSSLIAMDLACQSIYSGDADAVGLAMYPTPVLATPPLTIIRLWFWAAISYLAQKYLLDLETKDFYHPVASAIALTIVQTATPEVKGLSL